MRIVESVRTPGHVVTSAFAALKSKDYRALAELCDPISLRSFKAEMVEEFCDEYGPAEADETDCTIRAIELTDAKRHFMLFGSLEIIELRSDE